MMNKADLLIQNAEQLIQFRPDISDNKNQNWVLKILKNAWLAVSGENIVAVGDKDSVLSQIQTTSQTNIVDASGNVVSPGLIDPHTHPVFYHTREAEFEMRVQGKSYEEIAGAGGGIRNSVRTVREARKDELKEKVRLRLPRFLELGTTTIEAKSGYGLSFEDEVKSLEIIAELNNEQHLEMIPTFLGAHEIPDEYRADREFYIKLIIDKMIPYVAEQKFAECCDVFCEQGVYSVEESHRILSAANEWGLKIRLHADQLHLTGATKLAIELGAISADHLEQLDDEAVTKLAESDTIAGLLPGAVFFLGSHRYPPARKLINNGAKVSLATDFNPGSSMTQSMPLMMTLACLFMKMTPTEALTAATIHAAAALDRADQIGNLQNGYQADLVIWNAEDYRQIPYYYGVNLVKNVIKKGMMVVERPG